MYAPPPPMWLLLTLHFGGFHHSIAVAVISQTFAAWKGVMVCCHKRVFNYFHLEKGKHTHTHRARAQDQYPLSVRVLWKQKNTEGIVTRCSRGNTCSIPCWRNVFISLFTNVAISRCVHYKVHCGLDHSIKEGAASMGNLCRGQGYAIWTAGTV